MFEEYFEFSSYMGLFVTILSFELGLWLHKKFKLAIFNPPLISISSVIVFLLLTDIDYETYNRSAGHLSYLLTPATVCLAIPLYKQVHLLKAHYGAILIAITSGVLASALSIWLLSMGLGLDHEMYVTLLPKSITTAIGMEVSKLHQGLAMITIASICVTGVLGNMIAEWFCRFFRIKDPIARGLAIGTSSHATGTAKALEMGEIEGAMSSLSIVVAGTITVIVVSFFVKLY